MYWPFLKPRVSPSRRSLCSLWFCFPTCCARGFVLSWGSSKVLSLWENHPISLTTRGPLCRPQSTHWWVPGLDPPEALGSRESWGRVLNPRKDSDLGTTDPSFPGRGSSPHVHLTEAEAYFLNLYCLPTSFPQKHHCIASR